jgi:hypothetical protein
VHDWRGSSAPQRYFFILGPDLRAGFLVAAAANFFIVAFFRALVFFATILRAFLAAAFLTACLAGTAFIGIGMMVAVLAADGIGAVDIGTGVAITFDGGFFIAFEVGILHSCVLLRDDRLRASPG